MAWVYDIGVATYFAEYGADMINNATEFYQYMIAKSVTVEAICGMLGNIQKESTLNPAIKQSANTSSGWGLIQWTPSTVLTNWCITNEYRWYDGYAQCDRIWCEGTGEKDAGGYWLTTQDYPYTWAEFIALTSVTTATLAYLHERERASEEDVETRLNHALWWYEYFTGNPPPPEPPTPPLPPIVTTQDGMPLWMMLRRRLHFKRIG